MYSESLPHLIETTPYRYLRNAVKGYREDNESHVIPKGTLVKYLQGDTAFVVQTSENVFYTVPFHEGVHFQPYITVICTTGMTLRDTIHTSTDIAKGTVLYVHHIDKGRVHLVKTLAVNSKAEPLIIHVSQIESNFVVCSPVF